MKLNSVFPCPSFMVRALTVIGILLLTGMPALAAPPVISEISNQTTDEDTPLTVEFTVNAPGGGIGLPFPLPGIGDDDDDDDTEANFLVNAVTNNHILIPKDNITVEGSGTQFSVTLTPAPEASGEATVTITADDGSYSSTEDFVLTVKPKNDPPVITVPEDQETDEDVELVFSGENGNAITATDPDAGDNAVEASVSAEFGILFIENADGATISGNETAEISLTGSLPNIVSALDGLTYRPNPDWNGTDTLKVMVNDKGFTGSGSGTSPFPIFIGPDEFTTDNENISITVNPVDDPFDLLYPAEPQETPEDTPLTFTAESENAIVITDGDLGDFAAVLFIETGKLEAPVIEDLVMTIEDAGHLILEGPLPLINEALAGLVFEPDADWSGEALLTVTVAETASDDTKTGEIDILVVPVNDAPVLNAEAEIILFPVEKNDADPPGEMVGAVIADVVTDADDGETPAGIAAVAADSANGTWEFSTDEGTSWTAFGNELSEKKAVVLNTDAQIRFVPAADWMGQAALEFRAWDGSDALSGGTTDVDTTENGGESAFSESVATAVVSIQLQVVSFTISAGEDQTVSEGDTVSLNGADSQLPAEAQVTVIWSQTSGPDVILSDARNIQPTFTAPMVDAEGAELTFELTGTDPNGASRKDEITVFVLNSDVIRAEAGEDQEAGPGWTVTLSGSGSFIPDGVAPIYTWAQTGGPDVTLSAPDAVETTFITPEIGDADTLELVFELTVADNAEQSDTDEVTVTVKDESAALPPTASAGADITVKAGNTVTLDGSSSTDSDGTIISWYWSCDDAALSLSDPGQAVITFVAPSGGTEGRDIEFELIVTDNAGLQGADYLVVHIEADAVLPPGPGTGGDDNIPAEEGRTVELIADDAGAGATYFWKQVSGPSVTLSDPDSRATTFVAPVTGAEGSQLVFELTVQPAGGSAYTREIAVDIQDNGITVFPDSVLSFSAYNGTALGVSLCCGGELVRLNTVDPAEIADTFNRPDEIPYGLIDMDIHVANPGDTVTVTLYVETAVSDDYRWFQYTDDDGWMEYTDHTGLSDDRTEIRITLTDGGPGDSDKTADGIIRDPSGLGMYNSGTASSGQGGDGDDGGGCFVRSLIF